MREIIEKHPLIIFYGLALGGMLIINIIMATLLTSVPYYLSVPCSFSNFRSVPTSNLSFMNSRTSEAR